MRESKFSFCLSFKHFLLGYLSFLLSPQSLPIYILGQIAGALFFIQCFILIHEFGHNSFFKTKFLNDFFGHLTSIFIFIPLFNWRNIHGLHHQWTGWRDLDPTTEKTFASRLSPLQKSIINFCWKYYIPVFTIGYRLGIYWKLEKLKRHLPSSVYRLCVLNLILMTLLYLCLIFLFPVKILLLLPALYLSFVGTDLISLSQHSHIEIPVSGNNKVSPLKYVEQAKYSRSLVFPPLISKYLLYHINYHESHHCYPGLPCYYLPAINPGSTNSYPFWSWLKQVKKISGVEFIFNSSKDRTHF